jgi:hypothetical protein
MMKKLVIGGAAAALVVVGAASAAQLTGVQDTTLAGNQITVSGADLEGIDFTTTYVGGGNGNGAKTNVLQTLTIDLDRADVTVTGRLLQNVTGGNNFAQDVNGSRGGYIAESAATKFDGKVTDADGKVTFDLTWQQIPVENVDALDILVTG